jgi:phosphoribosylaminoimidazole (AIR) synthetase
MALVVEPGAVDPALGWLRARGLDAWQIGAVVPADGGSRYREIDR